MSEQEHIDELHDMAIRIQQIANDYKGKPHHMAFLDACRKILIARGQLMEAANAEQARAKGRRD